LVSRVARSVARPICARSARAAVYLGLVAVLGFLLLAVAFRSVLVPLVGALTNVATIFVGAGEPGDHGIDPGGVHCGCRRGIGRGIHRNGWFIDIPGSDGWPVARGVRRIGGHHCRHPAM